MPGKFVLKKVKSGYHFVLKLGLISRLPRRLTDAIPFFAGTPPTRRPTIRPANSSERRLAPMPHPGGENIPLDLSAVPTVEIGLERAAENDRALASVAVASLRRGGAESPILQSHIPFLGIINRAVSLHRGIVSAIENENPHVAYTLIRSYLELVALTYTIGANPGYLERLSRPAREQPEGQRPLRIGRLITKAAEAMPGIAHVYYSLSDQVAHFGTTAMFLAFSVTDAGDRRISYATAPHWKGDDDARTATAMLLENDETILYLLRHWDERLIAPSMEYWTAHPEEWGCE